MSQAGPRVSAVNIGQHPQRGWVVAVIAKRTYRVVGGKCVEEAQQRPLQEAPVPAPDNIELIADSDLTMHRELTDILVQGNAYPHPGGAAIEAGLAIDNFLIKFAVSGDRKIEPDGRGGFRFTPPERFEKVSLSWRSAYGGYDAVTYKTRGAAVDDLMKRAGIAPNPHFGLFAYPRNPIGKGYLCELTPETVAACALPNIEPLDNRLSPDRLAFGATRWPAAPIPVATTVLPHTFFPRSFWMGLPILPFDDAQIRAEDFFEVRNNLIPAESARPDGGPADKRFSPLVSQTAPVGFRARAVDPSATIRVLNLHPRESWWQFKLPGDRPRAYVRWPGQAAAEVQPQIRTLLIEPDEERVTLLWVGELLLKAPFPMAHVNDTEHAVRWRTD